MKIIITLLLAAALLCGCTREPDRDASDMKTLQKTVGRERLLQTFSQIEQPPMGKEIMTKSDQEIIAWIKQVDDWTHKVLSSPVTGEMDEYAMREMRTQLEKVYTPDMAQRMIDYFYRRDTRIGTYQANSTKAMLGLRSEWGQYELRKSQPAEGQYKLSLTGRTKQDYTETVMQHESAYSVQGDRLIVSEFKTRS
ncbi:hypothetical protein P4H70_32530 [Paenibacillus ehimensis]|uniref:hypothetical protein n=1 Tax=Paenibacillus ehimensis TaxID=79264 RepID=UPI002DB8A63D|nr:hypothetical protein [Paenibacillus ehimensis]MEC0213647.1 hypothetical protein [Paenibacillus ehimensis]